jgi:hypothetical protein
LGFCGWAGNPPKENKYPYGKTSALGNTLSTTNLEGEETVDAPGKDGNASMPEQVKRPNPWRKMMMLIIIMCYHYQSISTTTDYYRLISMVTIIR